MYVNELAEQLNLPVDDTVAMCQQFGFQVDGGDAWLDDHDESMVRQLLRLSGSRLAASTVDPAPGVAADMAVRHPAVSTLVADEQPPPVDDVTVVDHDDPLGPTPDPAAEVEGLDAEAGAADGPRDLDTRSGDVALFDPDELVVPTVAPSAATPSDDEDYEPFDTEYLTLSGDRPSAQRRNVIFGEEGDEGDFTDSILDRWIPLWMRWFLMAAVLTGLVIWAIIAATRPQPSDLPSVAGVPQGDPGTCYDVSATGARIGVSCFDVHDIEVIGTVQLGDGAGTPYPGAELLEIDGSLKCRDAFTALTGGLPPDGVDLSARVPTESEWAAGMVTVVCEARSSTGLGLTAPLS